MEDFDIHEFAKMFDAALASNNPSVKKALRNFLMITAIVHAQELDATERLMGPLETLIKKVAELENRVRQVEITKPYPVHPGQTYPWGGSGNPTWVYNGTVTSTSSANAIKPTSIDYKEIQNIMNLLNSPSTKYLDTLLETKDEQ